MVHCTRLLKPLVDKKIMVIQMTILHLFDFLASHHDAAYSSCGQTVCQTHSKLSECFELLQDDLDAAVTKQRREHELSHTADVILNTINDVRVMCRIT